MTAQHFGYSREVLSRSATSFDPMEAAPRATKTVIADMRPSGTR